MIGSLTFTRDDGETFTFSAVNPPYQLTPDTRMPAGLALDISGGEYTGRNGGYTLAGRLQRRTAKIVYNVRETYSDPRSMMQLLNDAAEFFRPMTADLRIVSFDMLVQTDDSSRSAYVMRRGHVTTPFMAPLLRGGHGSYAAEFDLIFDDPLLYWADGSGVVSGDILPAALPGSKVGEEWREGLQVWAAGLSRWEYPDQGGGGTPQTVHVVSAYQVPVAFTVTGQITNPKIVNSRNGSQWSWEGTIPYGCVVTVDVDGVALDWQGNRLLNTMGGLVAAPGDNTFTLTGSDLVLDLKAAWTGKANASPSTLSHDGTVVATNAAEDPAITQTLQAYSGEGSWVRSADATSPTGFSWTFTAKKNDWQWLGGLSLMGVKGLVSNPHPGEKMHVLMYSGSTLSGGVSLLVSAYNGSSWISQSSIEIIKPGTMAWHEGTFTMPTDPNIRVNLRSYYAIGDTGTVTLGAVMLLPDPDYQAMQSLGVDWFSGDSVPNVVTAKASVNIRGAF